MNSKILKINDQEKWAIILSSSFIIMIILYKICSKDISALGEKYIISAFLGLFYALLVAHSLIHLTVCILWKITTGHSYDLKSHFDSSMILGYVERTLFVIAIFYSKLELIGAWLILKTAGRLWHQEKSSLAESREVYQIFLIGSGLSIAYAFVGAMLIEWMPYYWHSALTSSALLLVANAFLYLKLKSKNNKIKNEVRV